MMFEVMRRIDGAHPQHDFYPLLPGDILHPADDGTWTKGCPGLMIMGFVLTDEQMEGLRARPDIQIRGLTYYGNEQTTTESST